MRDILVREQKYMQIEEATQGATNHPHKQGFECKKSKQQFSIKKKSNYNSAAIHKQPRHARKSNKDGVIEPDLIPFKILVDHVFNTTNDQPWARRPTRRLSQNPEGPESKDYYFFHNGMGHPTIDVRPSNDISIIWLIRNISESSSSTRDNPRRLKYRENTHHKTVGG